MLTEIIADPIRRTNLERRYWPKVLRAGKDDCWLWLAKAKHTFGYGRMTAGRGVYLKAHRIAYALECGPIEPGMCVCHSCDNPSCCNPAHLFLGTQKDNMGDAKRKGRIVAPPTPMDNRGERHPSSKITEKSALAIIADMRPAAVIAAEHGIKPDTVYSIRSGERWKHLHAHKPSGAECLDRTRRDEAESLP